MYVRRESTDWQGGAPSTLAVESSVYSNHTAGSDIWLLNDLVHGARTVNLLLRNDGHKHVPLLTKTRLVDGLQGRAHWGVSLIVFKVPCMSLSSYHELSSTIGIQ